VNDAVTETNLASATPDAEVSTKEAVAAEVGETQVVNGESADAQFKTDEGAEISAAGDTPLLDDLQAHEAESLVTVLNGGAADEDEPSGSALDEPVLQPEPDAVAAAANSNDAPVAPVAPAPALAPKPMPKPKAGGSRPAAVPRPIAPTAAADPAAIAAAEKFGEVDGDGNVFVLEAAGKRQVGSVPGASASDALRVYVQRFLALDAKVALFTNRLEAADLSVKEIDSTLTKLEGELEAPAVVGDVDGLRSRVAALKERAATRREELETARAAAKAEATAQRTALIERAEAMAAADESSVNWKNAGEEFRGLLDQWKNLQSNGPRIDRGYEDDLWKRFSAARTTFEKARRAYFTELDEKSASAKAKKEALIKEAEKLSSSTDFGATSGAYRDLMAKWKEAGRANRKEDDELWARFRAAQDKFFEARDAANSATDAEFAENLKKKEALLVEAEALLPIKDLNATKVALRSLQDRWDAAGKVPRASVATVENRMRAVETAVREAEQVQWKRSNPETKARVNSATAQLEKAIADLEADLTAAKAKGNAKKIAEIEASLTARKAWLDQISRSAE